MPKPSARSKKIYVKALQLLNEGKLAEFLPKAEELRREVVTQCKAQSGEEFLKYYNAIHNALNISGDNIAKILSATVYRQFYRLSSYTHRIFQDMQEDYSNFSEEMSNKEKAQLIKFVSVFRAIGFFLPDTKESLPASPPTRKEKNILDNYLENELIPFIQNDHHELNLKFIQTVLKELTLLEERFTKKLTKPKSPTAREKIEEKKTTLSRFTRTD